MGGVSTAAKLKHCGQMRIILDYNDLKLRHSFFLYFFFITNSKDAT